MKLDYRTKVVMAEVKQEMKDEFDYSISEHEIANIFQSQFKAAVYAMAKGLDFKIYKFMRFKRRLKFELNNQLRDLHKLKPLISKKEYHNILTLYRKQHKDWLVGVEQSKKQISFEEFIDAPNVHLTGDSYGKEKKLRFDNEEVDEYEYF
jgi:hypothetical protein